MKMISVVMATIFILTASCSEKSGPYGEKNLFGLIEGKKRSDVISLTQDEVEALKDRMANSSLADNDQKIVFALLSFNLWLQSQLQRAKLTIV